MSKLQKLLDIVDQRINNVSKTLIDLIEEGDIPSIDEYYLGTAKVVLWQIRNDIEEVMANKSSTEKTKIINGFPQQPIVIDRTGTCRFTRNAIVDDLLEWSTERGYSMNDIAVKPYNNTDRQQFAQLIGYSVGGFADLSYASKKVVKYNDKQVQKVLSKVEKCSTMDSSQFNCSI